MPDGGFPTFPHAAGSIAEIRQFDLSELEPGDLTAELNDFADRLSRWRDQMEIIGAGGPGTVSIETPVIKSGWLIPCIESILFQTSTDWTYSLLWDEGDQLARRILEQIQEFDHPKLRVRFGKNLGVARARRFLTGHSSGEYVLTIDDDDMMDPRAVELLLGYAREHPWTGIVRARRKFIDEFGSPVDQEAWFPFEPRRFYRGMVSDLHNHSQPNLIRRSAYDQTAGWEGFADFMFAGEDCDLYLKVEEVGSVELLDEVLYYYRLHGKRTSHKLTSEGAFEMWRRLADRTIERRGLHLRRVNDKPPFEFEKANRGRLGVEDVEAAIIGDGIGAAESAESVKRCGVSEAAIRTVSAGAGVCSARNEGVRSLSRRILLLVDRGIVFRAGAVSRLLSALDDEDADLAAPVLTCEAGKAPALGGEFVALFRSAPTDVGSRPDGLPADVSWLPASVLAVRREVFLSVGGFDERTFKGPLSEADFCFKARSRGFRCVRVPAAAATQAYPSAEDAVGLDFFRRKWNGHPELFRAEPAETP